MSEIVFGKINKKFFSLLFFLHILCILAAGCAPGAENESVKNPALTDSGFFFDTYITITVYDGNEEALKGCFDICDKYEKLFSKSVTGSDVQRINLSKGEPVKVSDETIKLILDAGEYRKLSGGDFDISIYPLSSLWNFSGEDPSVPDDEMIAKALSHISYDNIIINGADGTVALKEPGSGIDLGGIAKGYIADRLKDYLKEQKVSSALISLGGNILTVGTKPDGSPFNIGIQYPFSDTGNAITSVSVSDKSVVTSGIYERCFKKDNVLYHHILDPKTGFPVNSGLYSATIITDSSENADALSTICLMKGANGTEEIIKQLPYKAEAVLVTDKYEVITITN